MEICCNSILCFSLPHTLAAAGLDGLDMQASPNSPWGTVHCGICIHFVPLFPLLLQVLAAVGLEGLDLQASPNSLSDGYKRRLALAVQLVRPEKPASGPLLFTAAWRAASCCAHTMAGWNMRPQCRVLKGHNDPPLFDV